MANRTRVTKTVNGKVTFLDRKTPKEKALEYLYDIAKEHNLTIPEILGEKEVREAIDIAIKEQVKGNLQYKRIYALEVAKNNRNLKKQAEKIFEDIEKGITKPHRVTFYARNKPSRLHTFKPKVPDWILKIKKKYLKR